MIQQIQKAIKSSLRKSSIIRFGSNSAFAFQVGYKGDLVSLSTLGKQKKCGIDTITAALFYAAIARRGP